MSFDEMERFGISPDMIISCQPYSQIAERFEGIPKIQTLHGCADKRGELFGPRGLKDFTHLFSPGPIITDLAESRLLCNRSSGDKALKILKIGYLKVDDLFDGTYSREETLASLSLDSSIHTILYAPTWEKEASWEQQGLEVLDSLSAMKCNLLLKLHHLTLGPANDQYLKQHGHGGRDWRPIVRSRVQKFPRVRFVENSYANPLLVSADLLITDNSGIALEFVLLDKPIVFIETPLVAQQYGNIPLHQRTRSSGEIVYDRKDLGEVVSFHLQHPEAKEAERRGVIDRLVYNRGKATDAAMTAMEGILFG